MLAPSLRELETKGTGRTAWLSLWQGHEWFELRRTVLAAGEGMFYRGLVAWAFNEVPQGLLCLESIIKSAPRSKRAYRAHDLLRWMYLRRGNYALALEHTAAMRALKLDRPMPRDADGLRSVLTDRPPQSTVRSRCCSVPFRMVEGNMFVPVSINGTNSNFMIDSGATISMITETQAKKLDLNVGKNERIELYGATGAQLELEATVADQLTVGRFQLANVAFLVLNDDQFNFPDGYGGVLGLPVLLALQSLAWDAGGQLHLGFVSELPPSSSPNLCFDGPELVAEIVFRGRRLLFALDTGNGKTILWPRFSKEFPDLIEKSGRRGSIVLKGVSGCAELGAVTLPRLALHIGGLATVLRPVQVVTERTTPNSEWLYGRIGMDTLTKARRVMIDFNDMNLSLE